MQCEPSSPAHETALWREHSEWLFKHAPDAILVFNDELQYLDANPAACELLRREREEIVRHQIGDFSCDGTRLAQVIREAHGASCVAETHTVNLPDGSSRTVEVVTRPNMLPGIHFSFTRDVTERRMLEREVAHQNRLEAAGKLASGVAHDFNNMLTAILSYTDLQLQHASAGSPVHRYARCIQAAAERAADTTRQLLAFCRRQKMQYAETNVNEVLREGAELIRRLIGEDVELTLDLDDSIPQVWADAGQLNQVFVNLAVNARDALPRGGRLMIVTSRHLSKRSVPEVSIFVHDTGTGISSDVLPHIFDPFFTTKEQGKGTGLGLSTVYGIVKQMKGEILVNSQPGRGTTFEIVLPALRGEEEETQAALPQWREINLNHRPAAD